MPKPKGYVDSDYLQMAASLMQPFKQRTYSLMQIRPGQRVLDIGCGPGTDTIPLVQLVGSLGQVIGVDHDPGMVAEAERRAAAAGLSTWVKHIQADATKGLPCPSGIFDACRSERLFQHLAHPEQALAEIIRVTRSGGWIVALDTDHGTRSIDSTEVDIERRLARVAAERCLTNGYAGRQLYRLFQEAGLTEIHVETISIAFTDYALCREADFLDQVEQEALSAGIISAAELRRWRASLEKASAEGCFFASGTGAILAGRRPRSRGIIPARE
ncbi:MAG: methyltransferase domain-containing protein [Anaerolineales bacterium]|jgi:ubiquinone/menaquinone biosynthesis C-methylase UbiE